MSLKKAKSITLLLTYLADSLKPPKRSKLGADDLARLINQHWPPGVRLRLDGAKISAIRRGWHLKPGEQDSLLAALQSLMDANSLEVDAYHLPDSFERKYKLPPLFQGYAPNIMQGESLGGSATILAGAWQFFYVSPIDRAGKFQPEIRGFAVFVLPASASSTSTEIRIISKRSTWKGSAYVNGTHLYMVANDIGADDDDEKTESAFFVTNRPLRRPPLIIGAGVALTRFEGQAMPPVIGFVAFAEKWASKLAKIIDKGVVEKAAEGSLLSAEEIDAIRSEFCVLYQPSDLEHFHPQLFRYIRTVKINDQNNPSTVPGIHIAWI